MLWKPSSKQIFGELANAYGIKVEALSGRDQWVFSIALNNFMFILHSPFVALRRLW